MAEITPHFRSFDELIDDYRKALISFRPLEKEEATEVSLPATLPLHAMSFIGKTTEVVGIAKGWNSRKLYTPLILCRVGETYFPLPATVLFYPTDEIMGLIEKLPEPQSVQTVQT